MSIPLAKPYVSDYTKELVMKCLSSEQLSLGPILDQFEEHFKTVVKAKYALGISSGTSALHLAIRALNISKGDEVITTPFSFIASSNCILYEKAKPVFVDIDTETLGLNPNLLEEAITPKTKAIVAVHIYGKSCRIAELRELCDKHNLYLIEDCCEALGASHLGKPVGAFGEIATYGFYPNKHITTGEGGMLTTNHQDIAQRVKSLRNQGRSSNSEILKFGELGYNYRLSEVAAAMGLGQIQEWSEILKMRKNVLKWYLDYLPLKNRITFQDFFDPEVDSPFSMLVKVEGNRKELISYLSDHGIQSKGYFDPPIHLQKFYKTNFGYKEGDFPIAEEMSASLLALPFFTSMTEGQVKQVCEALANY